MPQSLFDALRWAHLLAGVVAFVVAPVALALRKGSDRHRLFGRIYVYPMSFAAASAVALALARDNGPFAAIGLFSFYLGVTGVRALRFKDGYQPTRLDQVIAVAAPLFFAFMFTYGLSLVSRNIGLAIPVLSFATVGLVLAAADVRRVFARRSAHAWLYGHMAGMVSSYIAAVSAFSVTNLTMLPLPVRILWPAAIGIPCLIYLLLAWRRRMAAGTALAGVS